jgi:HSP90 family molecular chaperone
MLQIQELEYQSSTISNLVKISISEKRQFMQAIEEEADLSLFDQFVVGFFSAFFVDRVVVISKHDDEKCILKSETDKNLAIKKDESGYDISRGIMIILYLKEGFMNFLKRRKSKI